MKLADYIANTYPEMSRPDQLLRLRRLLEMIRQIKEVSRSLTLGFSKLSLSEDLGMDGLIFYEMNVRPSPSD